jgi:hypothetical protein
METAEKKMSCESSENLETRQKDLSSEGEGEMMINAAIREGETTSMTDQKIAKSELSAKLKSVRAKTRNEPERQRGVEKRMTGQSRGLPTMRQQIKGNAKVGGMRTSPCRCHPLHPTCQCISHNHW